jgi:hypothetical protein
MERHQQGAPALAPAPVSKQPSKAARARALLRGAMNARNPTLFSRKRAHCAKSINSGREPKKNPSYLLEPQANPTLSQPASSHPSLSQSLRTITFSQSCL